VLDIRKGKRSTEIKGLNEPQGVFYSSRNGLVTTIPLNSHPESFQLEEGDPRIFVNVPKEFAVTARPAAHEKRDWPGSRSGALGRSDDQLHRELEDPFVGRQLRYA